MSTLTSEGGAWYGTYYPDPNNQPWTENGVIIPDEAKDCSIIKFVTGSGKEMSATDMNVIKNFKSLATLDLRDASVTNAAYGAFEVAEGLKASILLPSAADPNALLGTEPVVIGNSHNIIALLQQNGDEMDMYICGNEDKLTTAHTLRGSNVDNSDNWMNGIKTLNLYGWPGRSSLKLSSNVCNAISETWKTVETINAVNAMGDNNNPINIQCYHATTVNLTGLAAEQALVQINGTGSPTVANVILRNAKIKGVVAQNQSQLKSLDLSGITLPEKGSDNQTGYVDVTGSYTNLDIYADENFDKTRIIPEEAQNKVKEPVADPFVINGCSVTVIMPEDGAGTFADVWALVETKLDVSIVGADKQLCELKVTGPVNSTDLASDAFKGINVEGVDFSEATFVNGNGETDYSIIASAKSDHIHYVVMPENTPSNVMVNSNFAGFSEFYSAGTYVEISSGKYSLVATVKEEGELWGVTARMRALGSTPAVTTSQSSVDNQYYTSAIAWSPNVVNLQEIHLKGNLNARDLCPATDQNNFYMNKDGHLYWDVPADETSDTSNRTLHNPSSDPTHAADYGKLVYGLATNTCDIRVIDLEGAEFSHIGDMTLSTVGVGLATTNTYKVILPTSSSVNEIPADFLNSACAVEEICIPSNIEIIRTRSFATSVKHIWTTGTDPNVVYDNGGVKGVTYDADGYIDEEDTYQAYIPGLSTGNTHQQQPSPLYGTYTFSSNLKLIESHAFIQSNSYVKDVYCLGTTAAECHVDAFPTQMYNANNTLDDGNIKGGVIAREAFANNTSNYTWMTMLHFPANTVTPDIQRYMDPTRQYSIATNMRDDRGSTIYFPNFSEMQHSYLQATYGYTWWSMDNTRSPWAGNVISNRNSDGDLSNTYVKAYWSAAGQEAVNKMYTEYEKHDKTAVYYDTKLDDSKKTGVYGKIGDQEDYYDRQWPDDNNNTIMHQLYPQQGTAYAALNLTESDRDFRGWHQFALTGYADNSPEEVTHIKSYVKDNDWWTVCLPYNLTRQEVIKFFGQPDNTDARLPYVSKLLYVIRDVDNRLIKLMFSKNLMENKEDVESGKVHGKLDDYGVMTINEGTAPGDNDIVMYAGVPYMIRPNIDLDKPNNRMFDIKKADEPDLYEKLVSSQNLLGSVARKMVEDGVYTVPAFVTNNEGKNFQKESVTGSTATIEGKDYDVSRAFTYSFVGTFYLSPLPKYCYYLGFNQSKNKAAFYYNKRESETGWYWNNETGIICANWNKAATVSGEQMAPKITAATDFNHPARWEVHTVGEDSYTPLGGGGGAKSYGMLFDAAAVEGSTTGVVNFKSSTTIDNKVFNVNGQYLGTSLEGLPAGIYVVNGKKVVK